jgi:ABC-type transport system substrate-binding protein
MFIRIRLGKKGDRENMNIDRRKRLLSITFVAAFIFMALSPALGDSVITAPPGLNQGPNVDKIVFKVIATEDNMILALQGGLIDTHDGFLEVNSLDVLVGADNIAIVDDVLRNGYGHIKINTGKAPMNWTAFRRAFAFAFDKTRVQTEIFEGLSNLQDSLVVSTNDLFCIEELLLPHYYNAEVDQGNALLNASGFAFDPVTGFRNDPNGNPIVVEIAYSPTSQAVAGGTAQIGVDALRDLHIDAYTNQADFNTYISNLDQHEDYDMIFFATTFYGKTLDWMDREFNSIYADAPYQNPTNFRNETVDIALAAVLDAVTFEEAYAACAEVQQLLHYQVPTLITYQNQYLQAYRTDKFKGHVPDAGRYLQGKWSLQNVIKLDDTFGGTFQARLGQEPDSFNIFTTNSGYSANVLSTMWSPLYDFGPDLEAYPVLAESYLEETHADNADVPVGHQRFTFDLIQNATWSDGVKLTAEDVAFTYTYLLESAALGNPGGAAFGDLVAAYAPSTYSVVIEFGVESYWNFGVAAYTWVIPKHIFEPGAGIGYEGWNTWNPGFNPDDPMVTCGPFVFTDFEAGEFYEVTHNPLWAYYPQDRIPSTTPTTTATGTAPPDGFDPTLAIVAGAVGAAVVILVGGFVLLRQK